MYIISLKWDINSDNYRPLIYSLEEVSIHVPEGKDLLASQSEHRHFAVLSLGYLLTYLFMFFYLNAYDITWFIFKDLYHQFPS